MRRSRRNPAVVAHGVYMYPYYRIAGIEVAEPVLIGLGLLAATGAGLALYSWLSPSSSSSSPALPPFQGTTPMPTPVVTGQNATPVLPPGSPGSGTIGPLPPGSAGAAYQAWLAAQQAAGTVPAGP